MIKQAEELIKKFHGDLSKDVKESHCWILIEKTAMNLSRGYLTRGLKSADEFINIAEKYGLIRFKAHAYHLKGRYFWFSGDLERALEHQNIAIELMNKGLKQNEINVKDIGSCLLRMYHYNTAMRIAIDKDDIDLAANYFEQLEKVYKLVPNDFLAIIEYKLNKGFILQISKRSRDRTKAEELFNEVIEDKSATGYNKIDALVGQCELLLVELIVTSEEEVIGEIEPFLENLIELAQQWESDLYLTGAYIIQSKLLLLKYDIKSARRGLIKTQRIAESRGYNGVAEEIAKLHEDLKKNLGEWELLNEKKAPLSERIELARLKDHIKGQFRKKIMKMERVEQDEVTIYKDTRSCLVCKRNAEGFNIYVCPQCNSIYCRKCAQVVIQIENACWTCEVPIDITKPSKPFKQEGGPVRFTNAKKKI